METPPSKRQKVVPRTPTSTAPDGTAFSTLKVGSANQAYSKASPQRPSSIQFYSVFYSPKGSERKVLSGRPDKSPRLQKQQHEVAASLKIESVSKQECQPASQHQSSSEKASDQPLKARSSASTMKGCDAPHKIPNDDLRASSREDAAMSNPSRPSKGTQRAECEDSRALQETVIADSNAHNAELLGTPSHHQLDVVDDGEPTLPLTPTQRGLEPPPEPPSGLASLTPSKRSRRNYRSSPLNSIPPSIRSASSTPFKTRHYASFNQQADLNTEHASSGVPMPWSQFTDRGLRKAEDDVTVTTVDTSFGVEVCYVPRLMETAPADRSVLAKVHGFKVDDGLPVNGLITVFDVAGWAEAEFAPYLREVAQRGDLAVMQQAIIEYVRMTIYRAKCWDSCMKSLQKSETDRGGPSTVKGADVIPSQDSHLADWLYGREHFMVSRDGVLLLVKWKIVAGAEDKSKKLSSSLSARVYFESVEATTDDGSEFDDVTSVLYDLMHGGKDEATALKLLIHSVFENDTTVDR